MAENSGSAAPAASDAAPPNILLRRPGALELFAGPSKDDGAEKPADLRVAEGGFPEVDASSTEWSK